MDLFKKLLLWIILLTMSVCAAFGSSDKESDKRLHSNGGIWGFHEAESSTPKPLQVLLIGDSVMQGYRYQVAKELNGVANVDVWLTPAHLASPGLCEELAQIVSARRYDVIHFNIGLHGWPEGRIPQGQYEPLLRKYVDALRKNANGTVLVWASTTPVLTEQTPKGLDPEINPIIVKRNAIASKVMAENGIAENDLYSLMQNKVDLAKDKFHWQSKGIALQADSVTGSIIRAINANVKLATLTFDDGPHPAGTLRILDILKKQGVNATFFLIGNNVALHKELAKEIVAQGNEVGNHTLNHANLVEMDSENDVRSEMSDTQDIIEEVCGTRPTAFRSPYLRLNERTEKILKDLGLTAFGMTVQGKDFLAIDDKDRKQIMIPNTFTRGGIILMHDYDMEDVEMLDRLIARLKSEQYRFVTCGQLNYLKNYGDLNSGD